MKGENRCLACKAKIQGRIDKRFCDDHCRNVYHNSRNRFTSAHVRDVNRLLSKNRRILSRLLETDVREIELQQLMYKGFQPQYFTGFELKNESMYIHLYEYALCVEQSGLCRLVDERPLPAELSL